MSARRPLTLGAMALALTMAAAPAGCGPDEYIPSRAPQSGVAAMSGFSWVVDHRLAAMPRPGLSRGLEDDLAFLADAEIDLLISLTPDPISPALVESYGMEPMHIPVVDFTAPTMDQLLAFIDAALPRIAAGQRVGMHCTAGRGRTGTFMAAYFVSQGLRPEEAIAEIRALRPGSIETAAQERSIHDFYALLMGDEPSPPAPEEPTSDVPAGAVALPEGAPALSDEPLAPLPPVFD